MSTVHNVLAGNQLSFWNHRCISKHKSFFAQYSKLKPIVTYCPLTFNRLTVIQFTLATPYLYFKGFQVVFLASPAQLRKHDSVVLFSLRPHAHKAEVHLKCVPQRASVNISQLQICLEGSPLHPLGSPCVISSSWFHFQIYADYRQLWMFKTTQIPKVASSVFCPLIPLAVRTVANLDLCKVK